MVTSLIRKIFIYTIGAALILIAVYSYHIPQAGYVSQQLYFDNSQHSGAPLDLPVSVRNTDKKETTSVSLPSAVTCESETELCKKIKFIGNFSDADKRKYQSLIIKQIKNIDSILVSSSSIAQALYSITLDSDKGSRRGWAGKATITINLGNIRSQQEFVEILTHELGHIVDLGVIDSSRKGAQRAFYNIDRTYFSSNDPSIGFYAISWLSNTTRKRDAFALGFVGGYAMSDPFEDFAESFNMYLNHHHVFALMAANDEMLKKKYVFMEKLFDKKYLQADNATAISMQETIEERAWDTTKGY